MVVEGKGTYGIVLSSPRIPILDEEYEDIKSLNQVSKLLYFIDNKIYNPEDDKNIIEIHFNKNIITILKFHHTILYPQVANLNY